MATLAENKAAYESNKDYRQSGSRAKALAFISACEGLLGQLPARAVKGQRGEEEFELALQEYRFAIERAEKWLAANPASSATSRAKYVDFRGFRD